MPVEGRGLGSRQTQQAVRDREIGQPNNSETCSEAADGVTRESEGRSRLSLLCPVRQDQPRRHSGARLWLEPIFEADLPPEIYAYRAGRNAQQAVVEVEELLFRGHPDVVDA